MPNIYGKTGEASQQIGGTHPGEGWAEMVEERPGPDYVAGEDGGWLHQPASPLLTQAEFIQRFTAAEQAAIMTTPELAPLALAVLAAPSRMVDVTDATAQQARAALEGAGWSQERLDAIFAVVG